MPSAKVLLIVDEANVLSLEWLKPSLFAMYVGIVYFPSQLIMDVL